MEEIRIDLTLQKPEEISKFQDELKDMFLLNHTLPNTQEYDKILDRLFPYKKNGSVIMAPISGVRFHNVRIGKRVYINTGCLMMSAGGITIGDNAVVGASSVVTKDVSPNTIVEGNPAKVIKNIEG